MKVGAGNDLAPIPLGYGFESHWWIICKYLYKPPKSLEAFHILGEL